MGAVSNVLSERSESRGPTNLQGVTTVHWVYILQCADGTYYVGHTEDVDARVGLHNAGRAAAWTARRRPVILAYREPHPDEQSARQREAQIKRWTRAKKQALIGGDRRRLHLLSR